MAKKKNKQLDIVKAELQKVEAIKNQYLADGLGGLSPFSATDANGKHVTLDMIGIGEGYHNEDGEYAHHLTYANALDRVIADSLNADNPDVIARALSNVAASMNRFSAQADEDTHLSDSINGLSGHEIVPSFIIMEMILYMNSSIPELTGMLPIDRDKMVMYALSQVVDQASGDLQKGDKINTLNIGARFALKTRNQTFVYDPADSVGGEAVYEMKLYDRSTDEADETGIIAHNKTSCTFYRKNTSLNDFDVAVGSETCNPNALIGGKKVTLEIVYDDGSVKVKVEDGALEKGDKIVVISCLDVDKETIEFNRAMTTTEITPHKYISHFLTIGTESFKFDVDTVRRNLGLSLVDLAHSNNLPKVIEEVQEFQLEVASSVAYVWENKLDLTATTVDSNRDIYDHLIAEVANISNYIGVQTGFTSSVFCIGGSALSKAMVLSNSTPRRPALSGVKPLGFLGNIFNSYYVPTHDKKFPRVDADGNVNADQALNVYDQILVFGTSPKEEQKIMLGGFPAEGLRTEQDQSNKQSTHYKAIEGEFVGQMNNLDETHYMAWILLVKGIGNAN
jgi:hypothetical protein